MNDDLGIFYCKEKLKNYGMLIGAKEPVDAERFYKELAGDESASPSVQKIPVKEGVLLKIGVG